MTNATLTPRVDVRRAEERFKTRRAGWTPSTASASATTTTRTTPTTGCCWSTTMTSSSPGPASRPIRTRTWRSSPGCCRARWCIRTPPATPGVIYPGLAQRMSAGTRHPAFARKRLLAAAARRDQHSDPVHFVQMWVVPDEGGLTPGYEQLEIDRRAAPRPPGACRLRHARARRRRRHPDQEPRTPRCTPPGCSPARRRRYPRRPSGTFFVARGSVEPRRRRAAGRRATPCVHRHRRSARHRRRSRPRSSSGRCTLPSADHGDVKPRVLRISPAASGVCARGGRGPPG